MIGCAGRRARAETRRGRGKQRAMEAQGSLDGAFHTGAADGSRSGACRMLRRHRLLRVPMRLGLGPAGPKARTAAERAQNHRARARPTPARHAPTLAHVVAAALPARRPTTAPQGPGLPRRGFGNLIVARYARSDTHGAAGGHWRGAVVVPFLCTRGASVARRPGRAGRQGRGRPAAAGPDSCRRERPLEWRARQRRRLRWVGVAGWQVPWAPVAGARAAPALPSAPDSGGHAR